jgi:hypothetical protein
LELAELSAWFPDRGLDAVVDDGVAVLVWWGRSNDVLESVAEQEPQVLVDCVKELVAVGEVAVDRGS